MSGYKLMFIKPGPIQEEEKTVTVGFFKLVFFFPICPNSNKPTVSSRAAVNHF